MNRCTSLLLFCSLAASGCDSADAPAERVRIAALDVDLEGLDVCLQSDGDTRRFRPAGRITGAEPVNLEGDVFVAVVEPGQSCDSAPAVAVERHDLAPSLNDDSAHRTVVLSYDEDEYLEASMFFEVEGAVTSTRSCTEGDAYVTRDSVCTSSGTTTTVSLYECQSWYAGAGLGWLNGWFRTGSWTTTSSVCAGDAIP